MNFPQGGIVGPVVLISGEEGVDPLAGVPHFVLSRKYSDAVAAGGGLSLMPQHIGCTEDYVRLADALILTEGPPIHRGRYGKYYTDFAGLMAVSPTRDDFEFTLFRAFLKAGKPVLGIGRGLTIINAALGGTLLDLPKDEAAQGNTVLNDTRLGKVLRELPPAAESGGPVIEKLAPDLRVWAKAANKIIEGIEHATLPVFGVRWHGEWEDRILGDLVKFIINIAGGQT
jgi:putative glutamine amidotransferase